MQIEIQPHPMDPEIIQLVLNGRLDASSEELIGAQLLDAVEQCGSGLIFDFGNVEYVSSAGLRLLLVAYKRCVANGKQLAVVRLQPSVYKIFKLSALDGPLNIYQDDAAAIEAVWKKS